MIETTQAPSEPVTPKLTPEQEWERVQDEQANIFIEHGLPNEKEFAEKYLADKAKRKAYLEANPAHPPGIADYRRYPPGYSDCGEHKVYRHWDHWK